jgi:uncharacterized membrane protein
MDNGCDPFLKGILIGLLFGGFIIGFVVGDGTKRLIQKQAIDAGVAEYSVDKTTGVVTFTWIKK